MIVGLHGKMGAGKNEAARRLRTVTSLPVVEVSYAAKLKQSVAALLDVTLADIERLKNDPGAYVTLGTWYPELGWSENESKQTFRSFLQRYGTEAHRDVFGQGFWLDAALPLGRDYSDALYVVTDVRFPNEKQRIEELGGIVVRIIGPNEDTGDHASEQVLNCARTIDNTIRDDGYASLDRQLAGLPSPAALAA